MPLYIVSSIYFHDTYINNYSSIGKRWCQYRRERAGLESSTSSPYSSAHSTPTHHSGSGVRQQHGVDSNSRQDTHQRYSAERKNEEVSSGSQHNGIDNANKNSPLHSQNRYATYSMNIFCL